jgi:hypothetical protein
VIAVRLQKDQKEIEGARAEVDLNTVGEQLPLAQQHAETAEFESCVGYCQVRPICAVWQRISSRLHFSPPAWSLVAFNFAWLGALVASVHEQSSGRRDESRYRS